MDTNGLRDEARSLLVRASEALERGEVEQSKSAMADFNEKVAQADAIDEQAQAIRDAKAAASTPVNDVPVSSTDVKNYNPNDTTAKTKANYKPATWVKGLPAHAQPMWVQEQMGDNLKDEARVQTDTFIKWMKSPSEDVFWKTATPDEVKAMQEDKILCPIS